jgi:hypothetical protein
MKAFSKKVLECGNRISLTSFNSETCVQNSYVDQNDKDIFYNSDPYLTSLIARISYGDYIVETVDFHHLIWFCNLYYDHFYDLLNDKEHIYNISCKKSKNCRYSFKSKTNKIQFNFAKVYLSLDRKRTLKILIQHLSN